jgi:peptidoglycan/LPS O-acetylase OafA/YrhL
LEVGRSINVKKVANAFFASFSFALYLIHYSILDIACVYQNKINKYILLIGTILVVNFLSILRSNFTERYHKNIQIKFKKSSVCKRLNIISSNADRINELSRDLAILELQKEAD